MDPKNLKRLQALQQIAQLKADHAMLAFQKADQPFRLAQSKRQSLEDTLNKPVLATEDNFGAVAAFQTWAKQRAGALRIEEARARAQSQPYKEVAQRDAARRDVVEALIEQITTSERRRDR